MALLSSLPFFCGSGAEQHIPAACAGLGLLPGGPGAGSVGLGDRGHGGGGVRLLAAFRGLFPDRALLPAAHPGPGQRAGPAHAEVGAPAAPPRGRNPNILACCVSQLPQCRTPPASRARAAVGCRDAVTGISSCISSCMLPCDALAAFPLTHYGLCGSVCLSPPPWTVSIVHHRCVPPLRP